MLVTNSDPKTAARPRSGVGIALLMLIPKTAFDVTDWSTVEGTCHRGETGTALWRTRQVGEIRVRMVEYSPGYTSDHWCSKGHIVLCVEGEVDVELDDGRFVRLVAGQSYQVGDGAGAHRSRSERGAKLFIVD